MELMSPKNTYY